jgi:hypothetical protein
MPQTGRRGGIGQVALATLISVALAQWLELWYRFGATHVPGLFWGAFAPYTLIALAFHAVLQVLPRAPLWLWLVLGCLPGMALEWFVIGNAPWDNPDALQSAMVLFHGAWPIWGRMFDPAWFRPGQRRAALWLLAGATVLLLPGFLIADPDWRFAFFLLLPLPVYAVLWVIALWPARRDPAR